MSHGYAQYIFPTGLLKNSFQVKIILGRTQQTDLQLILIASLERQKL